jgi:hypothetical protein
MRGCRARVAKPNLFLHCAIEEISRVAFIVITVSLINPRRKGEVPRLLVAQRLAYKVALVHFVFFWSTYACSTTYFWGSKLYVAGGRVAPNKNSLAGSAKAKLSAA